MLQKIDKVTVYVSSQEEAREFWIEKLGFRLTFEQEIGPGLKWIEVAPRENAATTLVIYSREAMRKQNPDAAHHPTLMFQSSDPAADWKALKEKGVEVTDIQKFTYGTMFSFKDPDGNAYMVRD